MANKATKRSIEIRKERKVMATAYHEAAHAVLSVRLGRYVKKVSIVPEGHVLGLVVNGKHPKWLDPESVTDARTFKYIEREVMIAFAGHIAESKFTGHSNHVGATSDYRCAVDLAGYYCGNDRETEKLLDWLWIRTENFLSLRHNWKAIEAVAAELVMRKTISGRAARRVIFESFIRA
jgi:hypothetical protein